MDTLACSNFLTPIFAFTQLHIFRRVQCFPWIDPNNWDRCSPLLHGKTFAKIVYIPFLHFPTTSAGRHSKLFTWKRPTSLATQTVVAISTTIMIINMRYTKCPEFLETSLAPNATKIGQTCNIEQMKTNCCFSNSYVSDTRLVQNNFGSILLLEHMNVP
jgi:hypothetical protein